MGKILYFLTGMTGLLLYLEKVVGVPVPFGLYVFAVIYGAGLWGIYQYLTLQKRGRQVFLLISLALFCLMGFVQFGRWNKILPQYIAIGMALGGSISAGSVTEALFYGILLVEWLFFAGEFLVPLHLLCGSVFVTLLAVESFLPGSIDMTVLFCLLIYLFCLFLPGKTQIFSGTVRMGLKKQKQMAAVFGVGLVMAAVLISAWVLNRHGDMVFGLVYDTETKIYRFVGQLNQSGAGLSSDGNVSRDNNYRTGSRLFTCTVSDEPTEVLYLQGFRGGDYQDGTWSAAGQDSYEMQIRMTWGTDMDLAFCNTIAYSSLPNRILDMEFITDPGGIRLRTYYGMAGTEGVSDKVSQEGFVQREVYHQWTDLSHVYDANLYLWDSPEEIPEESERFYGNGMPTELLRIFGYAEAVSSYGSSHVNRGDFPRLSRWQRRNPANDLVDITAIIYHMLQDNTVYTLTPGRMGSKTDVVETFLFDRKAGYCVHYATAATILYRMYGIPARYVSGYAVSPESFEKTEDGAYRACVTDEDAHAWVEIFEPGVGWVPVEMTPGAGNKDYVFPGLDWTYFEQKLLENPVAPFEEADQAADIGNRNGRGSLGGFFEAASKYLFWLSMVMMAVAGIVFGRHRWIKYQKRRADRDCRYWFSLLLWAMHKTGWLTGCTGEEKSFPQQLCRMIPVISREEAKQLQNAILYAAYGPDKLPKSVNRAACVTSRKGLAYVMDCQGHLSGFFRSIYIRMKML